MTNSNSSDRLDRVEAILAELAAGQRDLQTGQRDLQVKQDKTQEQLDNLGLFIADISNDVAQLSANQQEQNLRTAQLTANVESLVSALQSRFTSNGQ